LMTVKTRATFLRASPLYKNKINTTFFVFV
jgi:hypothetical protein